jgi:hypothetical protein
MAFRRWEARRILSPSVIRTHVDETRCRLVVCRPEPRTPGDTLPVFPQSDSTGTFFGAVVADPHRALENENEDAAESTGFA